MREVVMLTNIIEHDDDLINRFEEGIDPLYPERSKIPARVLGYGGMSTVLTINEGNPDLVYKRMPMFKCKEELRSYLRVYEIYQEQLATAGIHAVPAAITSYCPPTGGVVVYIIQEKLDSDSLVNKAIQTLSRAEVECLFGAVLDNIGRVHAYKQANAGTIELGFDAQMSNWAIAGYEPRRPALPDPLELIYLDTSSPLLRWRCEEQLNPELFLRCAPSFLRWIIRLLFLDGVMNRYYDIRQVVMDVLANLYKEKREDVIPNLITMANTFLAEELGEAFSQRLDADEVAGYYREDAQIWRFYLTSRRVDRRLHRLLGKPYPYVLPGHIDR
jgi:hypothetical protein